MLKSGAMGELVKARMFPLAVGTVIQQPAVEPGQVALAVKADETACRGAAARSA
jgi:hypothetical protein